jgi:hypothetical protein
MEEYMKDKMTPSYEEFDSFLSKEDEGYSNTVFSRDYAGP